MAIAFDAVGGIAGTASGTGGSFSLAGAATGAWCYCFIHVPSVTETSTTFTGWTLLAQADDPNIGEHFAIFRRQKQAGDTTQTFSFPSSSTSLARWASYTGLDGTTPNSAVTFGANVLVKNTGATTTATPSVTNSDPTAWALACFAQRTSTSANKAITWTPDAATTERSDSNLSAGVTTNWSGIEIADSNGAVTAAAHSYTATANFSETHGFGSLFYLLPPAAIVVPTVAVVQSSALSRSYNW